MRTFPYGSLTVTWGLFIQDCIQYTICSLHDFRCMFHLFFYGNIASQREHKENIPTWYCQSVTLNKMVDQMQRKCLKCVLIKQPQIKKKASCKVGRYNTRVQNNKSSNGKMRSTKSQNPNPESNKMLLKLGTHYKIFGQILPMICSWGQSAPVSCSWGQLSWNVSAESVSVCCGTDWNQQVCEVNRLCQTSVAVI